MPIDLTALQTRLARSLQALPQEEMSATDSPGSSAGLPVSFYQEETKDYWIPDLASGYVRVNELSFRRFLRDAGMRNKKNDDETLSPVEEHILRTQRTQNVAYAGPLAGYPRGFHTVLNNKVLVTASPTFIEPASGDWPILRRLLDGLFAGDEFDQRPYVFGWLKIAIEALRANQRRPGQALAIAGEKGCGKSLFQNLITHLLGGRVAEPFDFMMGETTFNKDMFGAEHLKIEDEASSKDIRTRNNFGIQIKNITVNENQRAHGKYQTPVMLNPFWRLTITMNSEDEALLVLPPLSDSVQEKFILLRASKLPMPMPTVSLDDRSQFWKTLLGELPQFIHFLMRWEIPTALKCERFGVASFVHPDIEASLNELAPESKLLNSINAVLFKNPGAPSYEGTAAKIEERLTNEKAPLSHEARKILTGPHACGHFMSRLARKLPERFSGKRINGVTRYKIMPPEYQPEVFEEIDSDFHDDPEPHVPGCPKPIPARVNSKGKSPDASIPDSNADVLKETDLERGPTLPA